MPEMVQLDDIPDVEPGDFSAEDGRVPCPECTLTFKPSGIKRHITMTHRGGISDGVPTTSTATKGTKSPVLASRWKDFQLGAALLVSLACADCAKALSEDAEKDGEALAAFCISRPKLRKQIEQFLATADFMLLVGAFGGTAQKMISHHSIAKKLPFGVATNPEHSANDPAQRMMQFMGSMPEEQRHKIFDQALKQAQRVAETAPPKQAPAPEPVAFEHVPAQPVQATPAAGGEPMPEATLTDRDKAIIDAMHSDAAFSTTAGNLGT
jgi:hypothetical protein